MSGEERNIQRKRDRDRKKKASRPFSHPSFPPSLPLRVNHVPSTSLTCTSFQNLLDTGLPPALLCFASFSISACRLLLLTLASASSAWLTGACGGGPVPTMGATSAACPPTARNAALVPATANVGVIIPCAAIVLVVADAESRPPRRVRAFIVVPSFFLFFLASYNISRVLFVCVDDWRLDEIPWSHLESGGKPIRKGDGIVAVVGCVQKSSIIDDGIEKNAGEVDERPRA